VASQRPHGLQAGEASAGLQIDGTSIRLVAGDELRFNYRSTEGVEPGLIAPFAYNYPSHHAFRERGLVMPFDILQDATNAMLPLRGLDPRTASGISGPEAWSILSNYLYAVNQVRNDFLKQLRLHLKDRVALADLRWEPEWIPNTKAGGEYLLLGPTYQVFASEGINLSGLSRDASAFIRRLLNVGVILREDARRALELFGESI
jgi:hypothetical protein